MGRIVERCAHLCTLAIQHWAAQNRIRRLAFRDPLTGLGNRALLVEKFPTILERARSRGKEVAVFYVDIDGFRTINAQQGHKIGDQLLTNISRRIRNVAADADLIARLGADEFLIVRTARESRAEFEAMIAPLVEPLGLTTPIAAFNGGVFVQPDLTTIIEQSVFRGDVAGEAVDFMLKAGMDVWVYCGADWYVRDLRAPHVAQHQGLAA